MLARMPGIYLVEKVEDILNPQGDYKIPVFIGRSEHRSETKEPVNPAGNPDKIIKGMSKEDLKTNIKNELGLYLEDMPLYPYLLQFFEEVFSAASNEYRPPYIYFIDIGNGTVKDSWLTAFKTIFTHNDIDVLAFEGFNENSYTLEIAQAMWEGIEEQAKVFNFYTAFFTLGGAPGRDYDKYDTELLEAARSFTNYESSRTSFVEPKHFGSTIGKICITPFYREIGYNEYNNVEWTDIIPRTNAKIEELMNAGIIVETAQRINGKYHPRINLGVSTAFRLDPQPSDALLHTRYIMDNLYLAMVEKLYDFIKQNESEATIAFMQDALDSLTDEWIDKGYIKDGSYFNVSPMKNNPFAVGISSKILPVSCIVDIEANVVVQQESLKIKEDIPEPEVEVPAE